eukprot:TRINITY_DN80984_c0_g1_i1.p1 TRINITY_DN80984_c0_g1~~TRINITY_DN80984_c0_g1_i1.p1  ORF type:complete len:152 (-),score=23.69 TRINITY_DN80984_c0_g1_i1:125-580(-)
MLGGIASADVSSTRCQDSAGRWQLRAYNLRTVFWSAGMGLPGLWAALAGAQVVLTDCHPGVLTLLHRNVTLNSLEGTTKVLRLSWEERPSWLQSSFDVVIGSDILYEEEWAEALFAAASAALRPGGRLLLAGTERGAGDSGAGCGSGPPLV